MSRRSALLVAGADGHGSLQSQWPFKMLMLMQHGWIDMQLAGLLGLLPAAPASECTEVEKNCRGAKRTKF